MKNRKVLWIIIALLAAIAGIYGIRKIIQKMTPMEVKDPVEVVVEPSVTPESSDDIADPGIFYQKLKNGEPVNVLVLGDSISMGRRASEASKEFINLTAEWIRSNYGVECTLTNLSMGGTVSFAGIATEKMLDDGLDYDLTIICFGQNDDEWEGMPIEYEGIIRETWNKYPNSSIICVLESSQMDYTWKIQQIQEIAGHYGIQTADMLKAFQDFMAQGHDYSELITDVDNVHPGDLGHQIYFETLRDMIAANVEHFEPTKKKEPLHPECVGYDTFRYVPREQWAKVNDTTWKLTVTEPFSAALAISREYRDGNNAITILIDGQEYQTYEMVWERGFSQDRIYAFNHEAVPIDHEIELRFADPTVADGFYGFIFTHLSN